MRIIKYKIEMNEEKNPILVKESANNYPEIPSEKLTTPDNIGLFEISHGTVNMSVINGREVFIRLLLSGAVSFFLIHNHPSGDLTPSVYDIKATKNMIDAGKIMGIKLLDHIIIGRNSFGIQYYSFARDSDIVF